MLFRDHVYTFIREKVFLVLLICSGANKESYWRTPYSRFTEILHAEIECCCKLLVSGSYALQTIHREQATVALLGKEHHDTLVR